MFKKLALKRKIKYCKKRIILIEKKRTRSQAALVEAILSNTVPSDEDVDFFNMFTSRITDERDRMHRYTEELEKMQ